VCGLVFGVCCLLGGGEGDSFGFTRLTCEVDGVVVRTSAVRTTVEGVVVRTSAVPAFPDTDA
jgi:hypothetical protein